MPQTNQKNPTRGRDLVACDRACKEHKTKSNKSRKRGKNTPTDLRGSPKIGLHPQTKAIREKFNYKPIEKSYHKLSPTPFPKKQDKTLYWKEVYIKNPKQNPSGVGLNQGRPIFSNQRLSMCVVVTKTRAFSSRHIACIGGVPSRSKKPVEKPPSLMQARVGTTRLQVLSLLKRKPKEIMQSNENEVREKNEKEQKSN